MKPLEDNSMRGFTFAELIIGMAITSVVMAALMTFTMAVGTAWKAGEQQESANTIVNVANARVGGVVRRAMQAGAYRAGTLDNSAAPAAVVLWRGDDNGDEAIQLSEVALLQFDPVDRRIYRHTPPAGLADVDVTGQFFDESMIDDVDSQFERSAVVGKIEGMRLYRYAPPDAAPALEMTMCLAQGERQHIQTVTLSLRGAAIAPQEK